MRDRNHRLFEWWVGWWARHLLLEATKRDINIFVFSPPPFFLLYFHRRTKIITVDRQLFFQVTNSYTSNTLFVTSYCTAKRPTTCKNGRPSWKWCLRTRHLLFLLRVVPAVCCYAALTPTSSCAANKTARWIKRRTKTNDGLIMSCFWETVALASGTSVVILRQPAFENS